MPQPDTDRNRQHRDHASVTSSEFKPGQDRPDNFLGNARSNFAGPSRFGPSLAAAAPLAGGAAAALALAAAQGVGGDLLALQGALLGGGVAAAAILAPGAARARFGKATRQLHELAGASAQAGGSARRADPESDIEAAARALGELRAMAQSAGAKSAAFDGSPAPMMLLDRDLNVTQANAAMRRLVEDRIEAFEKKWPGMDAERLHGTSIEMFFDNPAQERQVLTDPHRLPHRTQISVGELKFAFDFNALRDDQGQHTGNVLEWVDVTEAQRNEAVMNAIRSEKAVIEFKPDGTIQTANENFQQAMGYTLDEIVGQHHSMFVSEEFRRSAEYQAFWEQLRRGEFFHGKFDRFTKSGEEVWLEATYSPITDASGKVFKVVKIATDITASERELKSSRALRNKHEAEQRHVVDALSVGLKWLSAGELDKQIEEQFADDYVQLRTDFNQAVDTLNTSIGKVVANTSSVRSGATEISQAADELARRTETQAATLEQTAGSLQQLTASVAAAAENATKVRDEVMAARQNAEASGQVVSQAVGAMSEIEKSSDQISQIISVIDDIAFQTNLLALNAGVEAARAGDAGKGFAVVASEVRALAQRSSEAAKEIKGLIGTSSEHVKRGVDLVGRTGETLKEMVVSVNTVSELITSMAEAAKEQSAELSNINEATNSLDQVTQQNAAMVEESTAASHALTKDAEELAQVVSVFTTTHPSAAVAASRDAAPKPAVKAQQARVAAFAGNAALDVSGEEAGWEDF
ncbi:methyl-accepting chemotaxis protein [Parvularcula oceani]|uniref:methyl-accepting chemotaxis protein n=1 Tax=Parvularcula oceani TaxID=1247963 RepID=UPI0012DE17DD|nr:methyl-accepting chemotaxis protein [Parvularcula oceani]